MASTIGIKVGALTATNTYADDAKVQATLLKFYEERGIGSMDATNQEKLQAIVDWIVHQIVSRARRLELEQRQEAAVDEVNEEYTLE
jgi:hypothetical protein